MQFSGTNEGTIRWGYRVVGRFTAWSCACDGEGGTLTAQLITGDDFGLSQGPLVVVVPTANAAWRWPVREMTRDGSTLRMGVGPME